MLDVTDAVDDEHLRSRCCLAVMEAWEDDHFLYGVCMLCGQTNVKMDKVSLVETLLPVEVMVSEASA